MPTTTAGADAESPGILGLIKGTFKGFGQDECATRAAALAYSTIFALPPLLILIVIIAGKIWGAAQVQSALEQQFSGIIGGGAAKQIHDMIAHGQHSKGSGIVGTVLGAAGLLLGATGAFLSLQDALNHAWEVGPDPKQGGVKNFIFKRLLSLGMVLGLGFLVAVSLALSAGITALTSQFGSALSSLAVALDLVISIGVLTLLFMLLLKFLPDGVVDWKSAAIGGLATALLFVIGKFAIGLYLGHSKPGDSFGAASAFAVIIVWIYYAGIIVLLGAEFTRTWAVAHGHSIEPRKGAVRVKRPKQKGDEVEDGHAEGDADAARAADQRAPRQTAASPRGAGSTARSPNDEQSRGLRKWILALPLAMYFFRKRS
jgi:membrane protein